MPKTKPTTPKRSDTETRRLILQFFYDRNKQATSARGKRGSAVRTSDLKKELKLSHGLSQQEVQSNLTYLISQGWVAESPIAKSFTAKGGTVVSSVTSYYQITAAGIDKIDGPGEFTMDRFHGIKIEATGQNIITVGDGNQVKAEFGSLAEGLAELRNAITSSDASEADKLSYVADIESMQAQLAKPTPNHRILSAAWDAVKGAAALNGCTALVAKVAGLVAPLIR